MKKQTSHAFNKDIYLLGKDVDGTRYWLEASKWDCGWYWGFGYVETYTNNRSPENSGDINSHQHWDSSVVGKDNAKDGGYCHNPFNSKLFSETTFTEDEGWELAELFSQAYTLRGCAEYFNRGKSNMANTTVPNWKSPEIENTINRERLPKIFARIYEILTK
jgi:hypothetical protein